VAHFGLNELLGCILAFFSSSRTRPEKVVNKKDVVEHTEEATLKITPMQAKSLVIWLMQNVKLYENTFGKIPNTEIDATKQEIAQKVDDLLANL